MRFTNKVVLVTGSTKGIGAQVARRFAAEGADVVVTGRSKSAGDEVVEGIRSLGGSAEFLPGDITVQSDVEGVIAGTVERFGALHVLVNNAAGVDALDQELKITDESMEAFNRQMQTGLYGLIYATKAAIPHMLTAGRGAVVNISSIAGVQGVAGLPAYSCTKGAVQAFSRQIASEYGKQGIRSNCIITGAIFHTDSVAAAVIGHPLVRAALAEVLLTKDGEMGEPDDIAEAALYLASDGARLVNGIQLPVDGGLTSRSSLPDISKVLADAAGGAS